MMRSLFSAVSGLKSHQTAMDVIGNNVSNVNTIGYKASKVIFQDIYSQTLSSATAPTTSTGGINAKQVGLGTAVSAIRMNMGEGSTMNSSSPLDFSVSGEGLFVVKNADGSYSYTRNGALTLDAQGYLVTANGDYVMAVSGEGDAIKDDVAVKAHTGDGDPAAGEFGKIQLSGAVYSGDTLSTTQKYSDYAVDSNGVITATLTDSTAKTNKVVTIGRLALATFANPGGLEKVGKSYYKASSNSGDPSYSFVNTQGAGQLNSGSLEMSNTDLATELTDMIITQRGYQANSRVITTSDTLLEELINLKR